MQVRTFSSITVKNNDSNLSHVKSLGYHFEVVGRKIKIEIPKNQYTFATSEKKLKEALGF